MATAQDSGFRILIDGKEVSYDGPPPRRKLGRVLVPLRSIFETMGAHVRWDDNSQTVFANRNDTKVELEIGSNNATVNGSAVLMDVPAQLIAGSTFVPLRFLSESLGARVDYDGQHGKAAITFQPLGLKTLASEMLGRNSEEQSA